MMNSIENPQLVIPRVSDSITVGKGTKNYNIQITSKSDFFKSPIVYKVTEDSIEFRKVTLDDTKKIVSPKIDKKTNFYHFYIPIDFEIDFKKYYFEDGCDEDIVSIYYR
jgi:hypothetical protein